MNSPLNSAEAARELLARRRARRYLLEFTRYTMPEYRPNWHHVLLAEHLDRFAAGRIKRLLIFLPPQHGKSELQSRRFPAFLLGQNPEARVIACSHTDDFAGSLNRDVQRIIDSDPYRRLFPETRLAGRAVKTTAFGQWRRTTNMFEIVGSGGYYRSAGVGGNVTGRGFSHGLIDDPFKSREQADSAVGRQRIWDWYANDFYTRGGVECSIAVTHTRWHRDDLAGRLLLKMADKSGDQWTVLNLPAIKTEQPTHPEDPRQPGEALWPAFKSAADLATIREQDLRAWASLYQQDPVAGGSEWPDEYFAADLWFDDWPADGEVIVRGIGLDPSKGKGGKHGDYSAFAIVAVTRDGTVYCDGDLKNDRDTDKIAATGVELCRTWQPQCFAVETNQFQELLARQMQAMAGAAGTVLPIYGLDNRESKEIRIRRLTPWLAQKKLRFKGGSSGARLLVGQLRDFPNGEHDDGPDALEMILRKLSEGRGREAVAGRLGG